MLYGRAVDFQAKQWKHLIFVSRIKMSGKIVSLLFCWLFVKVYLVNENYELDGSIRYGQRNHKSK